MGNAKVILGAYVPGSSWLHHLDPRVKLFSCFWYVVIVFLASNWLGYLWLFIVLGTLIALSRLPLKLYWRGIKPLFWIILFTVAIQLLFSSGGHVYWQWGWLAITSGGFYQSAIILARFILIITISTVLTATTPTLQLAAAMEAFMKPLRYLRVPVNQIAVMLMIVLRFIPTIMDETTKVMNAQKSRGVNFDEGSLIERARRLEPLLIPLFVGSFKRAEELATAMEARGYDPDAPRTKYRVLHWHQNDTLAMIGLTLATVILLATRLMPTGMLF
ncbi:energy-coupling factor transporter transmembrane component T family protein [Limosilactobacillus allomucosae]|uniref:energy-coupling factor transporter transmembrane component T family protein n=1 Tax=Limosilactobacillus allomucosae TaxID=3142938 RepID=UPI003265F1BD